MIAVGPINRAFPRFIRTIHSEKHAAITLAPLGHVNIPHIVLNGIVRIIAIARPALRVISGRQLAALSNQRGNQRAVCNSALRVCAEIDRVPITGVNALILRLLRITAQADLQCGNNAVCRVMDVFTV